MYGDANSVDPDAVRSETAAEKELKVQSFTSGLQNVYILPPPTFWLNQYMQNS